jgi:caspase-8
MGFTIKLLTCLFERGPSAIYALKEVLLDVENYEAYEALSCYDFEILLNDSSAIDLTKRLDKLAISLTEKACAKDLCSIDGSLFSRCIRSDEDGDGEEEAPEKPFKSTVAIKPQEQYKIQVNMKLYEGEDIYQMSSLPRGHCVIINNIDFEIEDLKRASAHCDGTFLRDIFQELGFVVFYYENLTSTAIKNTFGRHSKSEELKNHDAFIGVIMSHGESKDLIVGTDANFVRIEQILGFYNNFHCPMLVNKPKLFFIQACRGSMFT